MYHVELKIVSLLTLRNSEIIYVLSFIFFSDDIGSLRKQPKFIVFLTQLLALFKFCPTCKADHPLIEVEKVGTMAKIKLACSNDKCEHRHSTWHSQPFWENTKIPAGNLLLSFGILLAGGTATKALHILKIMGVSCMTLTTFFRHQRVCKTSNIFTVCTIFIHTLNIDVSTWGTGGTCPTRFSF